jgi:hypothetical protein
VSDPEKSAAKEAMRMAKGAAKEEKRSWRRETELAKQEKDRERRERDLQASGVEVMNRQFGLNRIVLYEKGYVQIFNTAENLAALAIGMVAHFDAADRWMKRTSRVPFAIHRSMLHLKNFDRSMSRRKSKMSLRGTGSSFSPS